MLEASGHCVEAFSRAHQFLEAYTPSARGCAILDVQMPGMDGLELQSFLLKQRILIPVIILTGHGDIGMAVKAVQDGAIDFLEKPADPPKLLKAVAKALKADEQSRLYCSEREEIVAALESLTQREREVMDLLIGGKSPKTVAWALGTQQSTVRVQRASIFRKMRADSATDLLRMVMLVEHGNGEHGNGEHGNGEHGNGQESMRKSRQPPT